MSTARIFEAIGNIARNDAQDFAVSMCYGVSDTITDLLGAVLAIGVLGITAENIPLPERQAGLLSFVTASFMLSFLAGLTHHPAFSFNGALLPNQYYGEKKYRRSIEEYDDATVPLIANTVRPMLAAGLGIALDATANNYFRLLLGAASGLFSGSVLLCKRLAHRHDVNDNDLYYGDDVRQTDVDNQQGPYTWTYRG